MPDIKRDSPKDKNYDFPLLIETCPELAQFVKLNKYGNESIDFFDPEAVKTLNKALLKHLYKLDYWDVPKGYLCPPIPGRADYIHNIANLLAESNNGKIPTGNKIVCMDLGVGANCVFPVIGCMEYGWSFIGSDIDPVAIESAARIIERNSVLQGKIDLRLQLDQKHKYLGIIHVGELIDLSVCNPPFHSSLDEARSGTMRKLKNLQGKNRSKAVLNFGGKSNELWCEGGEERFVRDMIFESKQFSSSCFWFSSLISKSANLPWVYKELKKAQVTEVKTIIMEHGNKTSRIIAWTFLTSEQKTRWISERWI